MIDTIVIRIHHLHEKQRILDLFKRDHEGMLVESIAVPEREAERFIMLKNARYQDNGKTATFYRNHLYVKSSSYSVTYHMDFLRNYIEFNFSIPKYKYGTNVAQFVNHYTGRTFELSRNSDFDFNLKGTFKRLHSFLGKFFNDFLLIDLEAIKGDVEINRFDICFNQVFADKQEALMYLKHQKKIRQKSERLINDKITYETSIYKAGKYFTFKIYHKGTEFWKNDAVELRRINRKKKCERFDIEKIGKFADKVLRYEIEFKNAGLNYLYKQKIYRKDCKIFKRYKKSARLVDRIWAESKSVLLKNLSLKRMKTSDWRSHEKLASFYHQLCSQKTSFRLSIPHEARMSSERDRPEEYKSDTEVNSNKMGLFSDELFKVCARRFKSFFNHNQIDAKTSFGELEKRVIARNERVKMMKKFGEKDTGMRLQAIKRFLDNISHYSEKELIQMKTYSRIQIYRMKKKVKELGFDRAPVTTVSIPKDDTFFKYHHFMMESRMFR